jgi:polysaccharide biosynthesis protein PslH
MRILWLSHFVPFPPKGGCFQRSFNLLARVGARHDVHLLAMMPKQATHPEGEKARAAEELGRHCASVQIVDVSSATSKAGLAWRAAAGLVSLLPLTVTIFESADVRRRLRALMAAHRFDVVHMDTISLAQYLPEVGGVPVVLTHHGAESFMIHRRIQHERNVINKAVFFAEWLALERYERRMMPRASDNVVMSEFDRAILARIAPDAHYSVVANGVDVELFSVVPPNPSARRIVFAGRLDQYSNRDAMTHFLGHVWPLIREAHPDVHLDVVGSNPPQAFHQLAAADARLAVHGFVPDVRPFFRDAAVAICPIRDGGGTRIKVFDALAQGVPLVSTTVGAEGIDVVDGTHVLLADEPAEFAAAVGRLLLDPALRATLAANGRSLVERRYSWDALAGTLMDTYERAAARSPGAPAATAADARTAARTAG